MKPWLLIASMLVLASARLDFSASNGDEDTRLFNAGAGDAVLEVEVFDDHEFGFSTDARRLQAAGSVAAGSGDSVIGGSGDSVRMCCMAMTASCLSCSQGISEAEFCLLLPDTPGCVKETPTEPPTEPATEPPKPPEIPTETPTKPPRFCCRAMTASCLACALGVSELEYCLGNPSTVGCEMPSEPPAAPVQTGSGSFRGPVAGSGLSMGSGFTDTYSYDAGKPVNLLNKATVPPRGVDGGEDDGQFTGSGMEGDEPTRKPQGNQGKGDEPTRQRQGR